MKKDLYIEKKIAKEIEKGKTLGIIKDKETGSIYYWKLIVDTLI